MPARRRSLPWLLTALTLVAALSAAAPGEASGAELWVAGASPACSDARSPAQVGSPASPWCTLVRAASQAVAGDVVRVRAAVYRGTVRPARSGTPSAPIRFVADEPNVVVDAVGAANALKLIGVSDVAFDGMDITGGTSQGVWIDATARIALTGLTVRDNAGAGIQVKASSGLLVDHATIADNGSAGILELAGTTGARYTNDTITGNGIGGSVYNGDGIQLGGSGALVADGTIAGNGDPGPYEHGIYTAPTSSGWTIERSHLSANGGANVKAAGGPGTIRDNRLDDGRYGIVLSDNPATVTAERNAIGGRAQHLVFLTVGATPARARLLGNTIVQTGRSTASGDASAIFVNAAAALELRDNLACYANGDALGVALWVNDAARLRGFASDANRFAATDPAGRTLAWNGSRTTLQAWRAVTGQDLLSVASSAPAFDASCA